MASGTRHQEEARDAAPEVAGAREQVRHLRRSIGFTEADLVEGTGANARTVRRWFSNVNPTEPQKRYKRQIDDLNAISEELADSLTPKGIVQWLRSRNRYLQGARPLDLLRAGDYDKVREAANALNEGYYQ